MVKLLNVYILRKSRVNWLFVQEKHNISLR